MHSNEIIYGKIFILNRLILSAKDLQRAQTNKPASERMNDRMREQKCVQVRENNSRVQISTMCVWPTTKRWTKNNGFGLCVFFRCSQMNSICCCVFFSVRQFFFWRTLFCSFVLFFHFGCAAVSRIFGWFTFCFSQTIEFYSTICLFVCVTVSVCVPIFIPFFLSFSIFISMHIHKTSIQILHCIQ